MGLASKLPSLNAGDLTLTKLQPTQLYRIYSSVYAADAFNASTVSKGRFSPLLVPPDSGPVVPTMYAGSSIEVAIMEVLLRDLPYPSAGHIVTFPSPSKEQRRATRISISTPLELIDFRHLPLQKLGLTRADVVDCNASHYSDTRRLAAWAYSQKHSAQGIVWTSRQLGAGDAFMLFGDRIPAGTLAAVSPSQPVSCGPVWVATVGLLTQLGASFHMDP